MCITEKMAERLLHPQTFKIDLESLPIEKHGMHEFRVLKRKGSYVEKYTGCQCYKDCNCADLYPRTITYHNKWYRSVSNDGTNRCFYSEPKL